MSQSANTTAKAVNDVQDTLRETEELLEQISSSTSEQAASLYARIAENLSHTKNKLIDLETVAVEKAKRAAKVTDNYVHENPWQSVGIGVAVGVLVGMLIARR